MRSSITYFVGTAEQGVLRPLHFQSLKDAEYACRFMFPKQSFVFIFNNEELILTIDRQRVLRKHLEKVGRINQTHYGWNHYYHRCVRRAINRWMKNK
jgi:hypothetical protein